VVFYDCYGGGAYLQPSDSRYECDTAIPQICNSLALECKTDFLLERRLKDSEFFQRLCLRLDRAVKYVKSFSESAIILLIIDAADTGYLRQDRTKGLVLLTNYLNSPYHWVYGCF
jgi:signal transduction protein with GAF and PtsI domain